MKPIFDMEEFVTKRLESFRDHTRMWGGNEAVELQAIQLLEIEHLLRVGIGDPRFVINAYLETKKSMDPVDTGNLPLFLTVESDFGNKLYDLCIRLREKLRNEL